MFHSSHPTPHSPRPTPHSLLPTLLLAFVLLLLAAVPAAAAGRVQLELVGDSQGGSPLVFQEWLQALSRAGIKDVRLRTAQATDRANIEVRGTEQSPIYMVTGVIGARDEIVLPGVRFRRSEMKQLAQWLDDLAQKGPVERREQTTAFGLTAKQLEEVQNDLAKPVGFSTRAMSRNEAIEKIRRQLGLSLRMEADLAEGGNEQIEEELSDLSSGTALACVLRPIGFCMVPKPSSRGLVYAVSKGPLDREVWPIGWPPDKPAADAAPALFEFRNVNVQNVSAAKVLEAIGTHVKIPVLLDHNALARHGIDPAKKLVSHPNQRTNYSIALRKLLFQAGLKYELRVDEAGKPLLWVTSVKPV